MRNPGGTPTTVFGSSGVLDYAGGSALIVLDRGSAQMHAGNVTIFAGSATLAASNDRTGEFILGIGQASVVFGGTGGFTYAGAQEAASLIGGSDGHNSLATGIGTVLVGADAGDSYLLAGSGNENLIGSVGAGGDGTDRFYLGSGSDAVGLGTGP